MASTARGIKRSKRHRMPPSHFDRLFPVLHASNPLKVIFDLRGPWRPRVHVGWRHAQGCARGTLRLTSLAGLGRERVLKNRSFVQAGSTKASTHSGRTDNERYQKDQDGLQKQAHHWRHRDHNSLDEYYRYIFELALSRRR